MWDFRFSYWCRWGFMSSWMCHCAVGLLVPIVLKASRCFRCWEPFTQWQNITPQKTWILKYVNFMPQSFLYTNCQKNVSWEVGGDLPLAGFGLEAHCFRAWLYFCHQVTGRMYSCFVHWLDVKHGSDSHTVFGVPQAISIYIYIYIFFFSIYVY